VAYKLELPPSSSIHHVFHVLLLKKVVGASQEVSSVLPPADARIQIPEKVLTHRMVTRGVQPVH
jgi:hypothetical protein